MKSYNKNSQSTVVEKSINIRIDYDASHLYEKSEKLRYSYIILNMTFSNKSSYEQNVELFFSESIEFAECVKFKRPEVPQSKSGAKIFPLPPEKIESTIMSKFSIDANRELSGRMVLKILQPESEYKIYVKSLSYTGKTAECAEEIHIKELKPYKA